MLVLTLREWPDKQDRQCTYTEKLGRFRATIVAWKNRKYYIFWVCVCSRSYPACKALPYNIVICGLSGSTIFYSKLFHKRHDFRGVGEWLNTKCVFWFFLQVLSEIFLILSRTEWDIIIKLLRSPFIVPVILVRFYWNLNFLNIFSKNTEISNFMKILLVGAKFFHADGRTDMTKLTVAFRNLVNAPRICCTDQRGFV
jgi:hypothetical protein